ncbi:Protein of unknown function (DUF4005) [Sarracenia purpurea var. burkii]
MGKTSRWFRALFGARKSTDSPPASGGSDHSRRTKEKKKVGLERSFNGSDRDIGGSKDSHPEVSLSGSYEEAIDANKHAIAVAAATAAVAEVALAAAQAAAEVVRLTSGGGSRLAAGCISGRERRRELAAVRIQSAFRAYLARRALRALKGLVRLQALVRGHIVRKQSADMLRRMQAMARIQARASANRAHVSDEPSHSGSNSSHSHHPRLAPPKIYDNQIRANSAKSDWSAILKQSSQSKTKIKGNAHDLERTHLGSNWLGQWMQECSWNSQGDASLKTGQHADHDERSSDKILEVDTWKPRLISKRDDKLFKTPQHVTPSNHNNRAHPILSSSGDVSSLRSLKFPTQVDQVGAVWANNENSPQVCSASSRPGSSSARRRGAFSPARSECPRSFYGGYLGYPNYMANTESSQAKFRSQSAPRPRVLQAERSLGSTMRSVHGYWDGDAISETGFALQNNFRTKTCQGSGRLDRPGMIRGDSTAGYNSSYGGRF